MTPPALGDFRVSSSGQNKTITAADCTAERLGYFGRDLRDRRAGSQRDVSAPSWVEAANGVAAHCRVNGSMASMDTNSTARPINFSVVLPATWSRRAAQLGGGGMNGFVPNLTGGGPGASVPLFSIAASQHTGATRGIRWRVAASWDECSTASPTTK